MIALLYRIPSQYHHFSQLSDMLTVFLAVERLSGGVGSGISVSAKGRASQLNYISCSLSMDCTV